MPSDFGGFPAGGAPVLIDPKDGSVSLTPEWSSASTTFTAWKVNVTNTSSGSASLFADFQLAGTSTAWVDKTGGFFTTKNGSVSLGIAVSGQPVIGIGRNTSISGLDIYGNTTARVNFSDLSVTLDANQKVGWTATSITQTQDLVLLRSAAATLQQGAVNSATPVAQTLQAQGSRSGTDSNVGGANYTLQSGTGTGTGTLSSLILKSPIAVASGTGAQTQTTGLTVVNGCAVFPAYAVASLPVASTVPYGRCFVTDALATLTAGIGTTVAAGGANKVPVFSDGTNWIIG